MYNPRRELLKRLCMILFMQSSYLLQALQIPTTSKSAIRNHQEVVTVWDNVVPSNILSELHKEASKSGLGHKAFTRQGMSTSDNKSNYHHDKNRPLIEVILDKILTELGDNSNSSNSTQFVEYWTRQEWRHIEAHADVDEHLAREQDNDPSLDKSDELPLFRYPTNGHVLYLQVGSEVKGPTCLFPNKSSGGDLLKGGKDEDIDLVIVPSVEGRLLRFDGRLLHAVPRPADLWFLPFVQGAPTFTPEELWGRSVILFNTWDDEPPHQVPLDEVQGDDEISSNNQVSINTFQQWEEIFSYDKDPDTCNEPIRFGTPAKIWLLGNERRRNYGMRTIKLNAPEKTRDLFLESHIVSTISLSQ